MQDRPPCPTLRMSVMACYNIPSKTQGAEGLKKILGCVRRADERFDLIEKGDDICVGVSGGKDSLTLLLALSLYRKFCRNPFTLRAATLTMGWDMDTTPIADLCRDLDVPYHVKHTQIATIIFDQRKEKNPCSLCANMRRGVLNDLAKSLGSNKIALGHNREDVLETMLMSWVYEGRIHTFSPKTYLDRKDITIIRPLVFAPEKHILITAQAKGLPIIPTCCPAAGKTQREEMKKLLYQIQNHAPGALERMSDALCNTRQYGLWQDYPEKDRG